jgi:hypothetical protein
MSRSVPEAYFVDLIRIEGDPKEYYVLRDGQGNLFSKDNYVELMQKLFDFYMLENVDELIEEHNKLIRLSMKMENYSANYEIEVQENEEGLYKIPKPNYKYKKFKNDKRNWSCTCDWCGKKVSSKTDEAYYTLNCSIFNIGLEHACSEECVYLIWKEGFKSWVYENGYQKYFEKQ